MSQLNLYNGALALPDIGEAPLQSLSENTPLRYRLDGVWNRGALRAVLERHDWNFATRTLTLFPSQSIAPAFGWKYVYEKPVDWVRTVAISDVEDFAVWSRNFIEEGNLFLSNSDKLYVRYVSDGAAYGGDFSRWSQAFNNFMYHYLAYNIVGNTTASGSKGQSLEERMTKALREAIAFDGNGQATQRLPYTTWTQARYGYRGSGRGWE